MYRKKEGEFMIQFKDAIQAVSASLNTGYSVENAFREAQYAGFFRILKL